MIAPEKQKNVPGEFSCGVLWACIAKAAAQENLLALITVAHERATGKVSCRFVSVQSFLTFTFLHIVRSQSFRMVRLPRIVRAQSFRRFTQ